MGYTGEARWCPEASSRGDAKQPRRRAGRRAGVHRRGREPRPRSCPDPLAVNAPQRLRLRLGANQYFS
jgi:hypothetical protein